MTCHEWQDIILTDYLDGELDSRQKAKMEAHLSQCQGCKEFLAAARKSVVSPFENAQMAEPPQKVWDNIREVINEQDSAADRAGFLERLKDIVFLPKPVLALATVLICLLAATATLRYYQQGYHVQSDVESVDYVLEELAAYDAENDLYDPMGIEEYFL